MHSTPQYVPHPSKVPPGGCVIVIGMAAAGKTTVGRELAAILGWGQLDTDNLIESTYGTSLQNIADSMSKEEFLDLEGGILCRLSVKNTVVSTGGSAVYRAKAMRHLSCMGPVVYISVPLPVILERIARKPERGLAINPGQTVEDLYNERVRLYEAVASHTVQGGLGPARDYALQIAEWLAEPA